MSTISIQAVKVPANILNAEVATVANAAKENIHMNTLKIFIDVMD
jgi:hypothetical protein